MNPAEERAARMRVVCAIAAVAVTPSPAASAIERSTLDMNVAFCFLTLLAGNTWLFRQICPRRHLRLGGRE